MAKTKARLARLAFVTRKRPLIDGVKADKEARAKAGLAYSDTPTISAVIQSFNHCGNIPQIVDALRRSAVDELIVCEDGSIDGSREEWRRHLTRPNDFLIHSNDIHEIRTYNRAVRFARGEFVVLLQDDDIPPKDADWVAEAVSAFRAHPGLAVLGCWNGCELDFADLEGSLKKGTGAGEPGSDTISLSDPATGRPFRFIDAVGIGPIFFRRADFDALGAFDLALSGPGEPGIWLDYEICLRAWSSGRQVGLFEAGPFRRNVGGQGTTIYTGSKRAENFWANLGRVRDTYAGRIDDVHRTIAELNGGLAPRPARHRGASAAGGRISLRRPPGP